MLLVIDILALVFPSISPFGRALAVHLIILPFSLVLSVLAPNVDS